MHLSSPILDKMFFLRSCGYRAPAHNGWGCYDRRFSIFDFRIGTKARNSGKTRGGLARIKESRRKGHAHGIEVERAPRTERPILRRGKREVTRRLKHPLLHGTTLKVIHP